MNAGDSPDGALPRGYRDALTAAAARVEALERQNRALADENRALLARMAVPGTLATIDAEALPPQARRQVIQRRIRALRRELRATFGLRRYAASAIIAVTATAAFVVLAAESVASWPLAVAVLCMGVVARSLLAQWPGFDEIEDRRRKLAALKSQLDVLRAGRRPLPARTSLLPRSPSLLDTTSDVT
jgi:hypothetical protein